MSAVHNPVPVLIRALAALQMVSDLEPSQVLTGAQYLRVVHARNELEGHIDGLQLDAKADAAITRGPQIAKAMGVRLPGVVS